VSVLEISGTCPGDISMGVLEIFDRCPGDICTMSFKYLIGVLEIFNCVREVFDWCRRDI